MFSRFPVCRAFRAAFLLMLMGSALAIAQGPAGTLRIDYPPQSAQFPPDFAPPTFLFHDPDYANAQWTVTVEFGDGAPAMSVSARGEKLKTGEIDYEAIGPTNKLPELSTEQQQTRTWKPAPATWEAIKTRALGHDALITITGHKSSAPEVASSEGRVKIHISKDPVGAPVFFRDVPLMPAELERGVIKPLPKAALPLVKWSLRYMDEEKSRVLLSNMPTCANCHSFSADGKTLGLDMDGPANDKGLYALVPIEKTMTIEDSDVIEWSSFRGKLGSKLRVGFMSRVSPSGNEVVTMVNPSDVLEKRAAQNVSPDGAIRLPGDVQGNFYVANFTDYRFLQVFYPTRGILAWYSRETDKLHPLPGADNPDYVHTNASWSPDGKWIIFSRAKAREPYPNGSVKATVANDPNETPIQYDIYRIPFNDGKGGKAEAIRGASNNGVSNSFAKVSPDGKWIVYTQARNGLLMRPDGKLFIVPAAGGEARRMNCNTPLMNSWHSFSPNGRWMAFSSKGRSPYTQMYLTHIDENGVDSPPILVENATAANRAVNIPEFVNIGKDDWLKIDTPAVEFYRRSDVALELHQAGKFHEAVAAWKHALEMEPDDTAALSNLAATLTEMGRAREAEEYFAKAIANDAENYKSYANYGAALARVGRFEDAIAQLEKSVSLNSEDTKTLGVLGGVLSQVGRTDEARALLEKALELDRANADAENNLGGVLARAGRFNEAIPHFEQALKLEPNSAPTLYNLGRAVKEAGRLDEGIRHLERAVQLTAGEEAVILESLSAMYADAGRIGQAVSTAKQALAMATRQNNAALAESLRAKIAGYEAGGGQR